MGFTQKIISELITLAIILSNGTYDSSHEINVVNNDTPTGLPISEVMKNYDGIGELTSEETIQRMKAIASGEIDIMELREKHNHPDEQIRIIIIYEHGYAT